MRLFLVFIFAACLSTSLGACTTGDKTPEPAFQVVAGEEDFEVREYEKMVLASVVVEGERYDAADEAFVILANYIFENGSRKIPMTAPVTQQIKMGNEWIVSFIMPAGETLESLPEPEDERISLSGISEHRTAALRFSGFATDKKLAEKTALLENWMSNQGLLADGKAIFAFYNHPLTLPFLRRNEVLFKLKPSE